MAKKEQLVYTYKPRNSDLLNYLLSEGQWLSLLKDKVYDQLITHLIVLFEQKNDRPSITFKQLTENVGDKRVSKWLPMIYEDLNDLNYEHPEMFRKDDLGIFYDLIFHDDWKTPFTLNFG